MSHTASYYVYRLWIKENSPLRDPAYNGPWIPGAWQYIGSRVSNDRPPTEDFGQRYHSSGDFEELFRTNPEEFAWEILSEHATKEDAWDEEHRQIDRIWDSPSCANRHNQNHNTFRPTYDENWRRKMSDSMQRKYQQDPEWRRKNADANRKRAQDPEWRRKMADLAQDPEWQRKNAEGARKRSASVREWRQKASDSMQRKYQQDPEYRQKVADANRKKAQDPEWRRKMADLYRKKAQDPEWRKRTADARRRGWVTRRARQAAASPQPPDVFGNEDDK